MLTWYVINFFKITFFYLLLFAINSGPYTFIMDSYFGTEKVVTYLSQQDRKVICTTKKAGIFHQVLEKVCNVLNMQFLQDLHWIFSITDRQIIFSTFEKA